VAVTGKSSQPAHMIGMPMGACHQIHILKITVHAVGQIVDYVFFTPQGDVDHHQPVILFDDVRVRTPAFYLEDLHGLTPTSLPWQDVVVLRLPQRESYVDQI
jgi:hypothetical protein